MESSLPQENLNLPRVSDLLATEPFERFLEFDRADASDVGRQPRAWFEGRLEEGKPFIIRGFKRASSWNNELLSTNTLADFLKGQEVDVQHCLLNRASNLSLRDVIRRHGAQGNDPLYARDMDCPQKWKNAIQSIVSRGLWHLGPSDLARHLPKLAQSHVVMAHVGTKGSFTGFHCADSGGVSLSLLTESEGGGPGSIWFGTDRQSCIKCNQFLKRMGKSPHRDWEIITPEQLRQADFPVYVVEQYPGDLVVFPSGASHQVMNLGKLVTTVAWNIFPSSSVGVFKDYLESEYNQICHEDVGRVPMIPSHTLQGACDGAFDLENVHDRRDVELMLDVFATMFFDERLPSSVTVETESSSDIFTCNFCQSVIWNGYLHCAKCPDFDLCLRCFIAGRSCKSHYAEYLFKQLMPVTACEYLIKAIEAKLARCTESEKPPVSLGELAAQTAENRRNTEFTAKSCHLCNCRHQAGDTIQCIKCAKPYCIRGLVRHFEIDLIPFLRRQAQQQSWECPCCTQTCCCPHCDFPQSYQPKGKYLTDRAKISSGMKRGFIDVTNPLGARSINTGVSGESPRPARKRPRLGERRTDEAAYVPVNPSPTIRRTQNPRAGGARNDDAGEYIYSDVSDDDSSHNSEPDQSWKMKAEPSSPMPATQLSGTARQRQADNVARNRSSSARRAAFTTPHAGSRPLAARAANLGHVHGGTPVLTILPDTTARSSRVPSLSDNRPSSPQQPTARSEQDPRTLTSQAEPTSRAAAAARETASRVSSSSVNRLVPSNIQATPHQSTSATRPSDVSGSPSQNSSASRNSVASRKEKLQVLRQSAELVLAQGHTSLYEKMCDEIVKVEAAIAEDQAKAQALFPGLQDYPQLAAEFREIFQF